MNKWTRRAVIATGGLVGGGLALGVAGIAFAPNRLRVTPDNRDGMPQLTTWVKIAPDNTVSVVIPHCEMGTGGHTMPAGPFLDVVRLGLPRGRVVTGDQPFVEHFRCPPRSDGYQGGVPAVGAHDKDPYRRASVRLVLQALMKPPQVQPA